MTIREKPPMTIMPPKPKAVLAAGRRLQVSAYDRASSLLIALLICVGAAAAMLLFIWFSGKITFRQKAVDVELTEVAQDGEGGGDGLAAGGSPLDAPSDEPTVGADRESADVQESINVLNNAVASKAVEIDDVDAIAPTRHGSYGSGGGIYGRFGPGRGLGHGSGKPGWPRHWEVLFAKNTLAAYARQLDFFKIELGVLMPGKIVYVYNLQKPKPDARIVASEKANEQRYYLIWQNGELEKADKELLTRAGVDFAEYPILKFLPTDAEKQLIAAERSYQNAEPKNIRKTRFTVQAVGNGFEFHVVDQILNR
jgi:hypothetical protein